MVCRTPIDGGECPALLLQFLWDIQSISASVAAYGCADQICGTGGASGTCGFPIPATPDCLVTPVPCFVDFGIGRRFDLRIDSQANPENFCDRDPFELAGSADNLYGNGYAYNEVDVIGGGTQNAALYPFSTHTALVDNLSVTLNPGPCPFSDFIHVLPPFDQFFGTGYGVISLFSSPVSVNAGETYTINWEPIAFAPNASTRILHFGGIASPTDGLEPAEVYFGQPCPGFEDCVDVSSLPTILRHRG